MRNFRNVRLRVNTIVGLFTVNRRAGALWAYAEEPGIGHARAPGRR
jgi:hypothetical protein